MTDLRSPVSMINFLIYRKSDGKIERVGRCLLRDFAAQPFRDGEALIEGRATLDDSYVSIEADPPQVLPRPTLAGFDRLAIRADNMDVAVMPLPVPGVVTIDGQAQQVPADDLRFRSDSPGRYRVEVDAWPYLPYEVMIDAS